MSVPGVRFYRQDYPPLVTTKPSNRSNSPTTIDMFRTSDFAAPECNLPTLHETVQRELNLFVGDAPLLPFRC